VSISRVSVVTVVALTEELSSGVSFALPNTK
jgi:hypothetical protein